MFRTNIADIKAHLSEYVERAARGERIVICRHNTPLAELRPVEEARVEPRPLGPLAGRPTFKVSAAFFEPLSEDELASWEGVDSVHPRKAATPRGRRRAARVAESQPPYGRGRRGGRS